MILMASRSSDLSLQEGRGMYKREMHLFAIGKRKSSAGHAESEWTRLSLVFNFVMSSNAFVFH